VKKAVWEKQELSGLSTTGCNSDVQYAKPEEFQECRALCAEKMCVAPNVVKSQHVWLIAGQSLERYKVENC
jgi:hypothetical protein